MENKMNSQLILENALRPENTLSIFSDMAGVDLVGFEVSDHKKPLTMCNEPIDGNGQEQFHLDKFNTGLLIDYLKRIYDNMDDTI